MKTLFIFALGAIAATAFLLRKPETRTPLSQSAEKSTAKLFLVASGGQSLNRS